LRERLRIDDIVSVLWLSFSAVTLLISSFDLQKLVRDMTYNVSGETLNLAEPTQYYGKQVTVVLTCVVKEDNEVSVALAGLTIYII